jgi:hypothetical protein
MVMMNAPAYSVCGFEHIDLQDAGSSAVLAGRVYKHYTSIARHIARPFLRLCPEYTLSDSPEVEEMRMEHIAGFIYGIKLGLVAYATGRLTAGEDELARSIFAEAVINGSIEQYDSVEPIVRNYALLRWMSMIKGPLPTWRGFCTALPTAGFGYGLLCKARCYVVDAGVSEAHRHVWCETIRGQTCTGMLRRNVGVQSSVEDVVRAVYSETPPTRFPQYSAAVRYPTQFPVLTDPVLGGPRRVYT